MKPSLLVASVCAGLWPWAFAPAAAPPARPFMAPLPVGAVARLGYARMVVPRLDALSVSPDGQLAVCDGRCFDLERGEEIPPPVEVPEGCKLERLFRGGAYLVSDREERILLRPGEKPVHLGPEADREEFDARGSLRLSMSTKGESRLLQIADMRPGLPLRPRTVATLPKEDGFACLAAEGGQILWWRKSPGILFVHAVASGKTREFPRGMIPRASSVQYLVASPDGKHAAVLAGSGEVRFFDTATGEQTRQVSLRSLVGWVGDSRGFFFLPNGRAVVVHCWHEYFVVPASAGEPVSHVSVLGASGDSTRALRLAPLPDSKRLLCADGAGVLRLLDLKTGKQLDAHSRFPSFGGVQALGGHRAAAWTRSGKVVVWDTRDGRVLSEAGLKSGSFYRLGFGGMHFSRDGRHLAAWWEDDDSHPCLVAETATGKVLTQAAGFIGFDPSGNEVLLCRPGKKDGPTKAAVFDLARREWGRQVAVPREIALEDQGHFRACFLPGRRTLFAAYTFGGYLQEAATGRARWFAPLPERDPKHRDEVAVALLAQSGRRAVIARLSDAFVLDTLSGQVLAHVELEGSIEHDRLPAVSASGRWLAAYDGAGRVNLYDLEAEKPGEQVMDTMKLENVTGISLDEDGPRLISAHGDGTCLVWDLKRRIWPRVPKKPREPWDLLASLDPAEAQPALVALAGDEKSAIRLFQAKLAPAVEVAPARIAGWVSDLASEEFERRGAAERELKAAGDQAEGALRQALRKPASLEQARYAERLLARLEPTNDGVHLRHLRALEILERSGSKEAAALLEKLAAGAAAARLTREAAASLRRVREALER